MSTAAAVSAGDRARERVRLFAQRRPEAVRLARLASLAVRVDSALLRALRLGLLPGTDVGTEADLWFSPLTESAGTQGFVLDMHVVEELRRALAAEVAGGQQVLLDRAWAITAAAHRRWPESMQIEEQITWLALKTAGPDDLSRAAHIESLLRGLLKAMTESPARGLEIARWAQRALRRLPSAARDSEAALLLALGAAERLGMTIGFPGTDRPGSLPTDATWVLPGTTFSRTTRIGVVRYAEGLRFVDADQAGAQLALPDTRPRYVQVSWRSLGIATTQTVVVEPGRAVTLPPDAGDIKLRTLAGDEFALDTVVSTESALAPSGEPDLRRACVWVSYRLTDGNQPGPGAGSGFFVAPGVVLSVVYGGGDASRVGESCHVTWQGTELMGTIIAERRPGEEMLVRVDHPPEALILERSFAVARGAVWQTVFVSGQATVRVAGNVFSTDAVLTLPDGVHETQLLLRTKDTTGDLVGIAGAPVVIDGRVAGHIVSQNVSPSESSGGRFDIYARPAAAVEQFIAQSLAEPAERPRILVNYPSDDPYFKNLQENEPYVERVLAAVRNEGFNPVQGGRITDLSEEAVAREVNSSAGGALIFPLLTPHDSGVAERVARALAYRRWAKPDFPLAAYHVARSGAPGLVERMADSTGLQRLDLDGASDEALRDYTHAQFGAIVARGDEGGAEPQAITRLSALLRRAIDTDDLTLSAAVNGVIQEGVRSEAVDWNRTLKALDSAEANELLELAAAFSLPRSTYGPMRDFVHGRSDVRAYSLNATSANVATALVRVAWLGQAPPISIVLTYEEWSSLGPTKIIEQVTRRVSQALSCSDEEARWLVGHIATPMVLIFISPPLPAPDFVPLFPRLLPSAVLLFMKGFNEPSPIQGVLELPPLEAGAEAAFVSAYTRRMEAVSPPAAQVPEPDDRAATDVRSPSVFISYSQSDEAAARKLIDGIRHIPGADVEGFHDTPLSPGEDWEQRMTYSIENCRLCLPLISLEAEKRTEGYFIAEWRKALDRATRIQGRRFIIPVVVDADTAPTLKRYPRAFEMFADYQFELAAGGMLTPSLEAAIVRELDERPPNAVPGSKPEAAGEVAATETAATGIAPEPDATRKSVNKAVAQRTISKRPAATQAPRPTVAKRRETGKDEAPTSAPRTTASQRKAAKKRGMRKR